YDGGRRDAGCNAQAALAPAARRYSRPLDTLGRLADPAFGIVSRVHPEEADTALTEARKGEEEGDDVKGTGASVARRGEAIVSTANSEERAKAARDVFQTKPIKRGISLKSLESGEPVASGKEFRLGSTLKGGISSENAKKISKIIRDEGPKGV